MPWSSDVGVQRLLVGQIRYGAPGTVTKATGTLTNFSHTAPDDVDVMLVAPNGRRMVLRSDVGGSTKGVI